MIDGFAAMGEPKSTVSTAKVAYEDWQPTLSAVGSLRAARGVDLAAEVSGLVETVQVRSGEDVKEGELLVQMVMDSDYARLRALQADAELARSVEQRARKQLAAQAISQAQADAEAAKLKAAEAAVAEQNALIRKKAIKAPFPGRLGITTVNPGQYLNPGDKLVTLQQLDPVHVDFTVPQSALAQLRNGLTVTATTDSFPGVQFNGTVTAINPVVDASTRNVKVQATLKNPERKLLPGMFTNVVVATGAPQRYLTLPANAVAFNPYGETVFVIVKRGEESTVADNKPEDLLQSEALKKADADLKAAAEAAAKPAEEAKPAAPAAPAEPVLVARQVFIKTGPSRGDQVAVISGLKEGDEVVTSGQIKLKNDTAVVINNELQPSSNPDPRPVDE
ncbi:efflux RND transporter periplasmic adaptor subunit [Stagnimonas aquatica]|uniref:Efflux RND transporter periplasmic adaptor subunit n=2 Tax=Stagnimonas aquatica TaxID=2689987 RepID=A0A3N0V1Z7_9GAMM|nr:efflux RND transporter periplasmic adaptor subunit [Stagnimonas aquatica]